MTDTFVQNPADQTGAGDATNLPAGDQAPAGSESHVDTKSPEYQLNVLQKRVNDKDEFIDTLKRENQETREMYASLEERLKNVEKIDEVLNKQGQNQQDVNNQATGLDENELVGKVIENLNKKQAEEEMNKNYNVALGRLNNEFGEQHIETKVQEAAKQNGLSVNDMVQTARKSPQAFYKLMGLEGGQRASTASPTRSTVNAPIEGNNEKDFAYFSRMMRENPREYWKPETQREFRKLFQNNKD